MNRSDVAERLHLSRMGRPNATEAGQTMPDLVAILGATAEPIYYNYQTDCYGLRNIGSKTRPDAFFLGDSILVAGLVSSDSIVSEVVQNLTGLCVLNVSEVGFSPQEALIRLTSTGVPVRNRIVVQFIFEGNDLVDSRRWRSRESRTMHTDWPRSGFVKSVLGMLHKPKKAAGEKRIAYRKASDGSSYKIHFLYDAGQINDMQSEFPHLVHIILDAKQTIGKRGGTYGVAFVPAKISVLHSFCEWPVDSQLRLVEAAESFLAKDLGQFCLEADIPFLDLSTALKSAAGRGGMPYFPADTHLNEEGHLIMAKELSSWLLSLKDQETMKSAGSK